MAVIVCLDTFDTMGSFLPETSLSSADTPTTPASEDEIMTAQEPTSCKRRIEECKKDDVQDDDSTGPSQKKRRLNRKPQKRVHFCAERDDQNTVEQQQIQTEIHEIERVDEMDIPNVWWTQEEMNHHRYCDGYLIHFYSRCDAYMNQLLQLLGMACGKHTNDSHCNGITASSTTARAAFVISHCDARGLEREMVPCFRQRKKHVVANVLKSQASLRTWKGSKQATTADNKNAKPDDFAAQVLASHYRKLAQPAIRFACLLAQGDAQEVVYEQNKENMVINEMPSSPSL
jgi:hypothetical protein